MAMGSTKWADPIVVCFPGMGGGVPCEERAESSERGGRMRSPRLVIKKRFGVWHVYLHVWRRDPWWAPGAKYSYVHREAESWAQVPETADEVWRLRP